MKNGAVWAIGLALIATPGLAAAGERVDANIECTPTEQKLVYDCAILLVGKQSGQPIEGAEVTVNADMPSMPMVHNVRPVSATQLSGPGSYHARIELEMHGQWALTLDVEGPTRDRVIEKLQFGDIKADAGDMGHDHSEMKHDSDGMSHSDSGMKHSHEGAMEDASQDDMNQTKTSE